MDSHDMSWRTDDASASHSAVTPDVVTQSGSADTPITISSLDTGSKSIQQNSGFADQSADGNMENGLSKRRLSTDHSEWSSSSKQRRLNVPIDAVATAAAAARTDPSSFSTHTSSTPIATGLPITTVPNDTVAQAYSILPPPRSPTPSRLTRDGEARGLGFRSRSPVNLRCSEQWLPLTIEVTLNPASVVSPIGSTTISVKREGVHVVPPVTINSATTSASQVIDGMTPPLAPLQHGLMIAGTSMNVAERANKILPQTIPKSPRPRSFNVWSKPAFRPSQDMVAPTAPSGQSSDDPVARFSLEASGKIRGKGKGSSTQKLLPGYPSPDEPLPRDATLVEVCQHYPNHLIGDHLVPFLQWEWTASDILRFVTQPLGKDDYKLTKQVLAARLRKVKTDLKHEYRAIMNARKLRDTGLVGSLDDVANPPDGTTVSSENV